MTPYRWDHVSRYVLNCDVLYGNKGWDGYSDDEYLMATCGWLRHTQSKRQGITGTQNDTSFTHNTVHSRHQCTHSLSRMHGLR